MTPQEYFLQPDIVNKKRYDALREFYFNNISAIEVANKYGYTLASLYSLAKNFREHLLNNSSEDFFFKNVIFGRKPNQTEELKDMIIGLRKQHFSVEEIVSIVNAKNYSITYGYVYKLLNDEGFARLPRRSSTEKLQLVLPKIKAPVATTLSEFEDKFHSRSTGVFAFLPYIKKYEIDKVIESSLYPSTKTISKLSSILSFLLLKLSNVKRYSDDDIWCMDKGLGLFAGLSVLPKSAWLSSYSSRVTKDMNLQFLRLLHDVWVKNDLLSDTCNLDFTTVPYWGDNEHLENNWSGKRNKALSSMLAVLAQDPDSGIIDYGDMNVRHKNESTVVLEYLDFYKQNTNKKQQLQYLVFDSKFTNYENLYKLEEQAIKFITLRRRGKNILEQINHQANFKTIRVEAAGNKHRTLKVYEENIYLRGYGDAKTKKQKPLRQVVITGNGKIKPALIITNDFEISTERVVRKYARRWNIEKEISEQIEFFHLNRVSSSMVIKVDFDLTMTILAHNMYRLLANDLERYDALSDESIYEKFIDNNGNIEMGKKGITIELKKKRELPQMLEMMKKFEPYKYSWLNNNKITFLPTATS